MTEATVTERTAESNDTHLGAPPRVAIVTPFTDGSTYLQETLDSVRAQTLSEWVHVLVDDGSTDGSDRPAEHAAAIDPRVRLMRQSRSGVAHARNAGAGHTGSVEYLMFLDADDVLEPSMLAELVAYMDARPRVGVAYSSFSIIDDSTWTAGAVTNRRYDARALSIRLIPAGHAPTPFETLSMWGGVLPSNALIRRAVFQRGGGFDQRCVTAEDTDLFMRLALLTDVHFVHKPLMRYRRHGSQATADAAAASRALDRVLAEKWPLSSVRPEYRLRLARALNLRRFGASAMEGFGYGGAFLRAGRWLTAGRFIGGALRRYACYCAVNVWDLSVDTLANVSSRLSKPGEGPAAAGRSTRPPMLFLRSK